MKSETFLEAVKGKLIVSCQALDDEPLHGAPIMAKMAIAAKIGGAVAIRANSPADIRAIKQAVDLPVIGLYKQGVSGVFITPTLKLPPKSRKPAPMSSPSIAPTDHDQMAFP